MIMLNVRVFDARDCKPTDLEKDVTLFMDEDGVQFWSTKYGGLGLAPVGDWSKVLFWFYTPVLEELEEAAW
jgi:hypothetical protein